MIEHCSINCGADSKKASMSPDLKQRCFRDSFRTLFWTRLVSIVAKVNKALRFLCDFILTSVSYISALKYVKMLSDYLMFIAFAAETVHSLSVVGTSKIIKSCCHWVTPTEFGKVVKNVCFVFIKWTIIS